MQIRKPKDGTPPPPQPKSPIPSEPSRANVGERVKKQGDGERGAETSDAWLENARKHTKNAVEKSQFVALEAHKTVREVVVAVGEGMRATWDWVKEKGNGFRKGGHNSASSEL